MPNVDHYTYRVSWSAEDGEFVGTCVESPSLSWLDKKQEGALKGIRKLLHRALAIQAEESRTSLNKVIVEKLRAG